MAAMEKNMDRISKLPDSLIHQILSYLSTKESARTSILSKTWLQSYYTFPNLTFNEKYFSGNRFSFFNFVNNTLLRFQNLNLDIHKFQIYLISVAHAPSYRFLDILLGVVFDYGVKNISVFTKFDFYPYTLPLNIFESPKMLTSLRVHQCKFPQNVATTYAIIFPFLKTLNLTLAYIDDEMLQKLLSSSPSLEEIVFSRVSGFKTFRVSNLSKLKVIDIESSVTIIEIDIEDAPTLCFLKASLQRTCFFNIGSAANLRGLELYSVKISDYFLKELVMKSPLLEDLKIDKCYGLKRINIVSSSLKRLRFGECKKLMEVKIDAPSLLKFQLHLIGQNMLSLSLNNTPEGLETSIDIAKYDLNELSNAWFHQLRDLLKGVKRGGFCFRMFHLYQGIEFAIVHDSGANPLPLEHQKENFLPEINQSSSLFAFAAFVEMLFSSSRPTMIFNPRPVTSPFTRFIKFLVGELITAAGISNCCSFEHQSKCWRHYLKDIMVEVYEDSQKRWQPLPQGASPSEFTFCGKMIRVNLKWYANLNAQV